MKGQSQSVGIGNLFVDFHTNGENFNPPPHTFGSFIGFQNCNKEVLIWEYYCFFMLPMNKLGLSQTSDLFKDPQPVNTQAVCQ